MPRANEQKIKLLVLYDILQRETDEEHPLSTNEIIERLSARGIEVSRKILPGDIALLNKYGFEILSYKKKSHYYYVAYRPFDSESYRKLQKEKNEWLKSLHLDENKILDIGSDYL